MQFTFDPKSTKQALVDQYQNQHRSNLDRRSLLKLGVATAVAGPSTFGTIRAAIVRATDPCESWAFQWRLVSISHPVARQERQSQPKPCAEC